MENPIINIVLIQLLGLFVFLFVKRNNANKFHLDYIVIHTFLLLVSTIIYKFIYLNTVETIFFDLINILHTTSFVFLILHVESAIKGSKSKIKWFFFIPIALYFLIIILNYFGVYILHYKTKKVYGKQTITITNENLKKTIQKDILRHQKKEGDKLFNYSRTDTFGKAIARVFSKVYNMKITLNTIRHSYITWEMREVRNVRYLENLAMLMGHSPKEQQLYRRI